MSTGPRGWWEVLVSGHSSALHPQLLSRRFPDGFEKFSPPILQLDEVDFYYEPKHVIFSRLSVSADLESRICVVWLLFFCSMSWNSFPSPCNTCCGLAQVLGLWWEEATLQQHQGLSQGFCYAYTVPTLQPHRAALQSGSLPCGTLWILRAIFYLTGLSSQFFQTMEHRGESTGFRVILQILTAIS